LAVASCVLPLSVATDSVATKVALAAAHLVAAAVIIPLVAIRMRSSNPRRA
jgi:hypothetical protein